MNYEVRIIIGNNIKNCPIILAYYVDYKNRESRFFKKHDFDWEKLKKETHYIMLKKGECPKKAWKQAWHNIRSFVRQLKNMPFKYDHIVGYSVATKITLPCNWR